MNKTRLNLLITSDEFEVYHYGVEIIQTEA